MSQKRSAGPKPKTTKAETNTNDTAEPEIPKQAATETITAAAPIQDIPAPTERKNSYAHRKS